jgi:protein-tyrosine-phosphatase
MAEAFARMHGNGTVEVYSAGSRPSGVVNATAIEVMRERGYDLTRHGSKSLAEIPDLTYDAVVTMGCGDACPAVRATHREDWTLPDPKVLPLPEFRRIRDLIERKVIDILAQFEAAPQTDDRT